MTDLDRLEDTLRGYLARRCKRAYAHDVRNGLQGIHGGVDALIRIAQPNKPSSIPLEQLSQFVRQAIANHERGLERMLEGIASEDTEPSAVSLQMLCADLSKFLANDMARRSVRLQIEIQEALEVTVLAGKLRLILLAILTDAIDASPEGSEVRIHGRSDQGVMLDIVNPRANPGHAFLIEAVDALVPLLPSRISREQSDGLRLRLHF